MVEVRRSGHLDSFAFVWRWQAGRQAGRIGFELDGGLRIEDDGDGDGDGDWRCFLCGVVGGGWENTTVFKIDDPM